MPLILAPRTHGRPPTDHASETPAPANPGRAWLTRLFAGELALSAVAPAPLAAAGRAPAEADAAARALACPDLFLIDAADRPARERVLADVLRAAAGRGERVLALSPDPAAADRIAEAVAAGHSISVVRALADDENPYRPSPVVTRLTSAAAGTGHVEQLKREAAARVMAQEARLARVSAAAEKLGQVREVCARLDELDGKRAELVRRLEALDGEVRAEADGHPQPSALSEVVARLVADHAATVTPLVAERAVVAAGRAGKEAALAAHRQHFAEASADAAKKSGFFTRLLGKPKHHADPAEAERQVHEDEREIKDLADREAKLQAEIDAAAGRLAAEREKRIADELAARRADLEPQLRALDAERDRLGAEVAAADQSAGAETERADAERELAAARAQLDDLTRTGPELARRFLGEARAVVGTPGCLQADPMFAPADGAAPPFDLLVLDHAEELNERDFAHLSRLAGRWVLAGDAGRPSRSPEPPLLARLARLLDREPWTAEADRLVVRLAHLPADGRHTLAREPVLDHPHVELRFAAGNGQPTLAEIAFPANAPAADVKAFLAAQLGEVRLRPCGGLHWHRADGRLAACWTCGPAADFGPTGWVELEPGVRERVCGAGVGAFTAEVAFDRAAGWDEAAAEAWLSARLGEPSPSRVAALPRPPRGR